MAQKGKNYAYPVCYPCTQKTFNSYLLELYYLLEWVNLSNFFCKSQQNVKNRKIVKLAHTYQTNILHIEAALLV